MKRSKEQQLVDICFSIALTVKDNYKHFKKKDNEFVANWVAEQLRGCGFDTSPCGSSWGVLNFNKDKIKFAQEMCPHSETEKKYEYTEGDYLNKSEYRTLTVCKNCGMVLHTEFQVGYYE